MKTNRSAPRLRAAEADPVENRPWDREREVEYTATSAAMARPLSPLLRGADEVVAETFKVLVLGNSDVGKTSLIRLYTTGETAANLIPTVGE